MEQCERNPLRIGDGKKCLIENAARFLSVIHDIQIYKSS